MEISFGNKIAIADCNIYNKKNKTMQKAHLYELNCNSRSDISYLYNKKGDDWIFGADILNNMQQKCDYLKYQIEPEERKQWLKDSKYYILESNRNILGACEAVYSKNDVRINYLTSIDKKDYKYIGSAILGAITAHNLRENGGTTLIPLPTPKSYKFYQNACGFSPNIETPIALKHENPKSFIEKLKNKIQLRLRHPKKN